VAVRSGDHAWRVHLEREQVTIEPGPGHAEATVTGEPSELLLWLWGRRPDSAVHTEGDPELVQALRQRLVLTTQ
jgi:MDMPI-like protein